MEKIGNIRADGRPILGLDSRDLLEIILTIDPRCHLIPAHIWTPWFSMLGSKSGFDSVEECFGDLTPHIFALETGLSSDPPMNWRISNLDRYTLVSNSDAHSPQKLAREATIFTVEPTYDALFAALRSGDPSQFAGTVEFFPEEGKYHLDGHRACNVCWEPETTRAHQKRCPVCGKEVTVGVMHRVTDLADRAHGQQPARIFPYYSAIPLPEILGEVHGTGAGSRRVEQEYTKLLKALGPELTILLDTPLEAIAAAGGSRLAEGIRRMRSGEVTAAGGYDGEYGVIRLFAGATAAAGTPQIDLFGATQTPPRTRETQAGYKIDGESPGATPIVAKATVSTETPALIVAAPSREELFVTSTAVNLPTGWLQTDLFGALPEAAPARLPWLARLNAEQRAAVEWVDAPLLIVAGPGTGKTRTLTVRIAHLIQSHRVPPAAILAITFTNKAAAELAERLSELLGAAQVEALTVATFHKLGAALLFAHAASAGLSPNFVIVDEDERRVLLKTALPALGEQELDRRLEQISAAKNQLLGPDDPALGAVCATETDVDCVAGGLWCL